MREAAAQKNKGRRTVALGDTKPAPVRGWNALDSIMAIREDEAIVLDNWFPRKSNLETRKGCASYATGFPTPVFTVMTYNGISSSKLFAATDTGIYDASAAGAIGAAAVVVANGKIQHVNHSLQGGNYLVCVNGVDLMQVYNGTAWQAVGPATAPIAITGLVTSTFIHTNVYKERLFFVIKDSMSFAYLPPAVVGGVAAAFPLDGIFTKGGYLMAMGTWSVDAGDGIDDHAVFITSEGEIAIYTGTDPGDPANWSIVGVYALGKPFSRKCFCKMGGELLLVLRDGIFPLSTALMSSSIDRSFAITNKVDNAWQDSAGLYSTQYGWCAYVFKEAPFLLCNIPNTGPTTSVQYVMNTTTKAWARFTGMGGVDFTVMNGRLFAARNLEVVEMWTGTADYTNPIQYRAKTGFTHFGYPGNVKHWTTVRPILEFTGGQGLLIGLDVDFENAALTGSVDVVTDPSAVWDTSLWDFGVWGADAFLSQSWVTVASRPGFYAATKIQHSSTLHRGKWFATNYIFETGGLV